MLDGCEERGGRAGDERSGFRDEGELSLAEKRKAVSALGWAAG